MCMISTPIEKVSKTKILVAPNHSKTSQLVVYSNYVKNISNSNAMVLPVPNPHSIKFIDQSGYKNLFEDCAKCFYNPNALRSYSLSNSANTKSRGTEPLEIFNVGSYKVSLAKNIEEISRVNKSVFELSTGLAETLSMFYYQNYWGFIICKLNLGPESYHPLAYTHDIINGQIFIPTRHYHEEVEIQTNKDIGWTLGLPLDFRTNTLIQNSWDENNIDQSPMFRVEKFGKTAPEVNGWLNNDVQNNNSKSSNNLKANFQYLQTNNLAKMSSQLSGYTNIQSSLQPQQPQQSGSSNSLSKYSKIADDWDHTIYLMNINPKSNNNLIQMNSCKEFWDENSLFDTKKIQFDFGPCENFEKIVINSTHPNMDIIINVN